MKFSSFIQISTFFPSKDCKPVLLSAFLFVLSNLYSIIGYFFHTYTHTLYLPSYTCILTQDHFQLQFEFLWIPFHFEILLYFSLSVINIKNLFTALKTNSSSSILKKVIISNCLQIRQSIKATQYLA